MNQGEEDIVTAGMGWADLLPNVYKLMDPNTSEMIARTSDGFGAQDDPKPGRSFYRA